MIEYVDQAHRVAQRQVGSNDPYHSRLWRLFSDQDVDVDQS
jgi:hypothetical protein